MASLSAREPILKQTVALPQQLQGLRLESCGEFQNDVVRREQRSGKQKGLVGSQEGLWGLRAILNEETQRLPAEGLDIVIDFRKSL